MVDIDEGVIVSEDSSESRYTVDVWSLVLPFAIILALYISWLANKGLWVQLLNSISYEYTMCWCYMNLTLYTPQYFMILYTLICVFGECVIIGYIACVALCLLYIIPNIEHGYSMRTSIMAMMPSIILFLLDPMSISAILLMASIILVSTGRRGQGFLLYGIAVAFNWIYILLAPSFIILIRKPFKELMLIFLPPAVMFVYAWYNAFVLSVIFWLWDQPAYSFARFLETLGVVSGVYFPNSILILVCAIAFFGFIAGVIFGHIIGITEDRIVLFTMFMQLFGVEVAFLGVYAAPIMLSIHVVIVLLMIMLGVSLFLVLALDALYVVAVITGIPSLDILYRAVLIVLVVYLAKTVVSKEMVKKPAGYVLTKILCDVSRPYVILVRKVTGKTAGVLSKKLKKARSAFTRIISAKIIRFVAKRKTTLLVLVKLAIIYLICLLIFLYRISLPQHIVFDEFHYVRAAREIIQKGSDPRMEHPPLVKYLIVLGIRILGDNPLGWRLPIVVFSALTLPSTYYIAWKISNSEKVAAIATSLLMLDPMFYSLSRLAMLDGPSVGLATVGMALTIRYMKSEGREIKYLYLSGIFLGLAISSKMPALMAILAAIAIVPFPHRKYATMHLMLALIVTPSIVFILTYIPLYLMMITLYGPPITKVLTLYILLRLLPLWVLSVVNGMFAAYSRIPDTQPTIESHPWEWPVGWKPIRGFMAIAVIGGTIYTSMVVLLGNPFTWLVGLASILIIGVLHVVISTLIYLDRVFKISIIKSKSDVIKNIKTMLDPIALIVLWGLLIWLAYLPASIAHWFSYYYRPGTNWVLDNIGSLVISILKEGRPSYIFYMYHILPPIYITLAYLFDKIDKDTGAQFSIAMVLLSAIYFLLMYPIISGAVWINYTSIIM